ncbi:MAG: HD domain-containing protein, partial [Pseudomonadota bacterium]
MTDTILKDDLCARITAYDAEADTALLQKAIGFSTHAHRNQMRASGQPYVTHPLAVANILMEKRLDAASIITGILHDTVEDTEASLDDIKKEFGAEIAGLVDGVTKISQLDTRERGNDQAENFRKFIMAISKDIRVLMVKIA